MIKMWLSPAESKDKLYRYKMFLEEAKSIAKNYGVSLNTIMFSAYLFYAPMKDYSRRFSALLNWREAESFVSYWYNKQHDNMPMHIKNVLDEAETIISETDFTVYNAAISAEGVLGYSIGKETKTTIDLNLQQLYLVHAAVRKFVTHIDGSDLDLRDMGCITDFYLQLSNELSVACSIVRNILHEQEEL